MSSPTIPFSVAEFEQAGLLDTTDLHLGDAPGSAASSQTADDEDYITAILQNTAEPAALIAQAQQLLARTVNQQSRESEMPQASSPRRQVTQRPKLETAVDRENYKKQLNREHQRQYRQRQQVALIAWLSCCPILSFFCGRCLFDAVSQRCKAHCELQNCAWRVDSHSVFLQAKTKALNVQLAMTKEELEKSKLHQHELEAKLKEANIGRTSASDSVPATDIRPDSVSCIFEIIEGKQQYCLYIAQRQSEWQASKGSLCIALHW